MSRRQIFSSRGMMLVHLAKKKQMLDLPACSNGHIFKHTFDPDNPFKDDDDVKDKEVQLHNNNDRKEETQSNKDADIEEKHLNEEIQFNNNDNNEELHNESNGEIQFYNNDYCIEETKSNNNKSNEEIHLNMESKNKDVDEVNLNANDMMEISMNQSELDRLINNTAYDTGDTNIEVLGIVNPEEFENIFDTNHFDDLCEGEDVLKLGDVNIPPANGDEEGLQINDGDVGIGSKQVETERGVIGNEEKISYKAGNNWKKNINKKKRMHGENYERKLTDEDGVTSTVTGGERKLKPRGCGARCTETFKRSCWSFAEADRRRIFENFWKLEWQEKKSFVVSIVEKKEVKERTVDPSTSRRKQSLNYYLTNNETRLRVCKNFFLSTLDIGEQTIYGWLDGTNDGMVNESSKSKKRKVERISEKLSSAKLFLSSLPKVPSHYCRASSNKSYLEHLFVSFTHLYREYKSNCNTNGQQYISRSKFYRLYLDMNLAIYRPKKDLCDICCSFQAKNLAESIYNAHMINKEAARAEKSEDKERSKVDPSLCVLTVDLQAVLLAPCLNASAMYYKTKLSCHNYTVFDLSSKDCTCYFWHEDQGELDASIFASCLCDYISSVVADNPIVNEIIIFSDGCTYQNRNVTLSNALLKLASDKDVTVVQKYLEKGHTQMECDSVHSSIERQIRGKQIYSPYNYVEAIKAARIEPKPYKVKHLNFSFFKDYTKLKMYTSIRPGSKAGDPCVTDIKALKYTPDGEMQYKIKFDSNFEYLPRRSRSKSAQAVEVSNLYEDRLPIKSTKYKHLQELKSVIPPIFHHYYDNLPHA